MKQRKDDTRRNNIFDQVAKKYDTEKQIELADVIVAEVKSEFKNSQSKTLLDYGTGTGLVGLELSSQVESILFIDSSEQMLEIVKNKISKKEITNARVLLADFTTDTPDLKVDIVLLSLVLLHIPDTKRILQKLFDVLNEGGQLIIIDFDKNDQVSHPMVHSGFTHEFLKGKLSETGFKSTKIRTFYSGSRIFMNQDATMFKASAIK